MWNDLPFELKSDSKLSFNRFVKKKLKKSLDTNNKYEDLFVCSYSVLIFIFIRLNLSVAAAINTLNDRYDFLYVLAS